MAALDTNVLVRYLVGDDPRQFAAARGTIQAALDSGETLFIPTTVALELEWVLRSSYRFQKADVIGVFSDLLAADELSFESETAVEGALALFQESSADFADCVHVSIAHSAGETPLWTFDRSAAKLSGAELLSS